MTLYAVKYETALHSHMSEPVEAPTPAKAVEKVVGRNSIFADAPADDEFKVYELTNRTSLSRRDVATSDAD